MEFNNPVSFHTINRYSYYPEKDLDDNKYFDGYDLAVNDYVFKRCRIKNLQILSTSDALISNMQCLFKRPSLLKYLIWPQLSLLITLNKTMISTETIKHEIEVIKINQLMWYLKKSCQKSTKKYLEFSRFWRQFRRKFPRNGYIQSDGSHASQAFESRNHLKMYATPLNYFSMPVCFLVFKSHARSNCFTVMKLFVSICSVLNISL
jgi:hypothetical protein